MPVRMSARTPSLERARGTPCVRSMRKMITAAAEPRPLTMKAGVTPYRAMTRPPSPGPTMRAALNEAELRATALATLARPTISATSDCRAGWSSTFTRPEQKARRATCQYSTWPEATRAARPKAWPPCAICVITMSRRFCTRSARAPEAREKSRMGANWSEPISPSLKGDEVSWRTSHDWATVCIQLPVWATIWAPKKRRKSARWSARSPTGRDMSAPRIARLETAVGSGFRQTVGLHARLLPAQREFAASRGAYGLREGKALEERAGHDEVEVHPLGVLLEAGRGVG